MASERFNRARLRELRRLRHLSQRKIAETLGIQPHNISNYERGEYDPSYETLVKLAAILECRPDDLLVLDTAATQ
jgi:transcriptional regulator with XRE-family HTH domain